MDSERTWTIDEGDVMTTDELSSLIDWFNGDLS